MGIFGGQLANVVEWEEYRDDILLYKWNNREIKKGSRLIIRAGQDAIFMYNGKVEGVFTDPGSFDIESDIIPFLTTLSSFKFGFNTPMRAEVIFINTKEVTEKWGTKNAVMLPFNGLPGGLPVRAFGTFSFKVSDYLLLIEKVAGVKNRYTSADVKERVLSVLDPVVQRWMVREGKDMFNLQANAPEISRGVAQDLDMELSRLGLTVTNFSIQSVSYPEDVAEMVNKAAGAAMVGDTQHYTQVQMANSLGKEGGSSIAGDMAAVGVGLAYAQQMVGSVTGADNAQAPAENVEPGAQLPKFCPNCGAKNTGTNFCPNCGAKLKA